MQYNESGNKTFTAYAALEPYRRVKIQAGAVDPPYVTYAGAGEVAIGITLGRAAAQGDPITIALIGGPRTHEVSVLVDSAIARGTVLYGAASGQLSDASSGSAQAIALEAGVDDAVIEVFTWNVLSTTAATVSIADAGEYTAQTTVEAALQEIYKDLLTIYGTTEIPLTSITREDGTALTTQATTVAGFSQIGNKEVVINIPINCTAGEALQATISIPYDLDDTADVLVEALVSKAADLDTLTLDCEVYPCAAGDLQNADIQDTAAQAIVAAGTVLSFTCGADGVLAAPGTMTVVLTLGGTNDGDAVYIYGLWLKYKKKLVGVT